MCTQSNSHIIFLPVMSNKLNSVVFVTRLNTAYTYGITFTMTTSQASEK